MRVFCVALLLVVSGCKWMPQLTAGTTACDDGRANGLETDVDCGGPSCGPCADDHGCLSDSDCLSDVCVAGRCAAPSCSDRVLNGSESAVDCGGACAPCGPQQHCRRAEDCASGACVSGTCTAMSCTDLVKSGDETDVDCGGSCPPCLMGMRCVRSTDCEMGECVDGVCGGALACVMPLLDCGGSCVDARFDHDHCGGCGSPCQSAEVCFQNSCLPTCSGGLTACPNGCVDLTANRDNCGQCGHVCEAGEVCVANNCVRACPATQTDCFGTCFSTDRDRFHCGNCTNECAPGTTCVGGQCTPACAPPLQPCDGGVCIDPDNDPMNCGGCGIECQPVINAIPDCQSGMCGLGACIPGFDDCDGQGANGCETDLSMAPAHCGSCGRACQGGDMCLGARCCGALPSGPFQTTCTNCEACDGVLSCLCQDGASNAVPTSIPLNPPCPAGYTNCNGVLLCDGC